MSSVCPVPETELMDGGQLSADDAWHTVRRYHLGRLFAAAFLRFRYGDGFSHARAFALQLALAVVPLVIAGAGLAVADNFDDTYGPLTAVMALLLWANVTGLALLAGIALAAKLEAVRAGRTDPLLADLDNDGIPDIRDEDSTAARRSGVALRGVGEGPI